MTSRVSMRRRSISCLRVRQTFGSSFSITLTTASCNSSCCEGWFPLTIRIYLASLSMNASAFQLGSAADSLLAYRHLIRETQRRNGEDAYLDGDAPRDLQQWLLKKSSPLILPQPMRIVSDDARIGKHSRRRKINRVKTVIIDRLLHTTLTRSPRSADLTCVESIAWAR